MASLALLTDDLLLDIFLRLAEPADLVRIAAACVPFRRLVADRAFLRRFRSLHPAPLLDLLDHNGFHPALPPHSSAPAARAVSLAADFSFSFLPASSTGRGWVIRDVRDGRVLLDRSPEDGGEEPQVFTEIAVCDPLHRRSVLLPPIPIALATAVEHPLRLELDRWCEHFLVPHGTDGGDPEDETSFGVICMVQCKAKLVAVAFSSTTGEWRAVASMAWRDLMAGLGVSSRSPAFSGHQNARGCVYWIVIDWRDGLGMSGSPAFYGRQYARGCFYWSMKNWLDKLLVLDARKMEFSTADVPPGCHNQQIAVVEAGEGRVGMFALCDHVAGGAASLQSLHYSVRRDDANGSNSIQWQAEKIIPLDPRSRYCIMGAMERYTLLLRFPQYLSLAGVHASSSAVMEDFECFSMDARTLQHEKVCELDHHIKRAYVYTNFPPSLSPQSI